MKEKFLEKATDMFLNLGFKSVTMDNLAHEMGISKKTIYAHFENKTMLVEETTMGLFYTISQGIDHICALEKDPIDELFEIKKFAMLHLKNEKSSPQYQLQKYYPKIYNNLRQKQFDIMQECVIDNIKRGMQLGVYRTNLNIDFVSRIYFSGITSIKDKDLFPQNKFPMTDLINEFIEYHLRGIITSKGQEKLKRIINSNQE